MLKADVNNAVYDAIIGPLKAAGFKGARREGDARRTFDGGFQKVGIPLADYRPTYIFSLVATVRLDVVEELMAPFRPFAPENRHMSASIIVGPEHFGLDRREFRIEDAPGLAAAAGALGQLVEERMLPWLEQATQLAFLESIVNAEAKDPGQYMDAPMRAMTGVAMAALCGRHDLDALIARHRASIPAQHIELATFEQAVAHVRAMV
jgi:hypothetical protein